MLKTWLATAVAALSLSASAANAAIVTFEDHVFAGGNPDCVANSASSQGMNFGVGYACYYGPGGNEADFPQTLTSTVMAATVWDAQGLGMTIDANQQINDTNMSPPVFDTQDPAHQFSLISLDLSTGPDPDFTGFTAGYNTLTGYFADGSTQSRLLFIGASFQTYNINWSGLTNVIFRWTDENGELLVDDYDLDGQFIYTHPTYLAFDNIVYNEAAVPEPATWAIMLVGFGGIGAALRSNRRRNLALRTA